MASNPATAQTATGNAFGTPAYRGYVLGSLTILYTLNFIDRILIGILARPIMDDFQLSGLQFGLLSGIGFALFYTLLGIPIARISEKYNRVRIIAFGVILWSLMTALCGVAWGFFSLLIFRVGVGVGEACLTPPANSIIADYFPPRKRAKALGTYALGITLGGVFAAAFGGPIAQNWSWQTAFIVLGLPGVFFGLLFLFTVKEPPRGYSDPPGTPKLDKVGILETLKEVSPKPAFWLNVAAASLVAFVGYGVTNFQVEYFQRAFEMPLGEAALFFSVPLGLAASLGAFLAGLFTEKLSGKYPGAIAWIPGISLIVCVPFYFVGFSSESATVALAVLLVGAVLHYTYLGAQYTICQGVASGPSRATAVAIMLFIINLIGYGLGPPAVGYVGDLLIQAELSSLDSAIKLTSEMCRGSEAELATRLGAAKAEICLDASIVGRRWAIIFASIIFGVAGALYLYTCRFLQRDLVAKMS